MIIESCVDSHENSLKAQQKGASQIELCSRLDLDGLSPGYELTKKVLADLEIPVKVMVRPRAGDFEYTDSDKAQIRATIDEYKELEVTDFVYGSIKNGSLDLEDIEQVVQYIKKDGYLLRSLTIHKAIDKVRDPLNDIDGLKILSMRYPATKFSILTSGQCPTALEGTEIINRMIDKAGTEIEIIAAGKITTHNLAEVQAVIKATAFHGKRIVG